MKICGHVARITILHHSDSDFLLISNLISKLYLLNSLIMRILLWSYKSTLYTVFRSESSVVNELYVLLCVRHNQTASNAANQTASTAPGETNLAQPQRRKIGISTMCQYLSNTRSPETDRAQEFRRLVCDRIDFELRRLTREATDE